MKKFFAVLLPVVLIGAFATAVAVSANPACPVADEDARWDHLPMAQLPAVAARSWAASGSAGVALTVRPFHGGRWHPDGATILRGTPAGREWVEGEPEPQNFVVAVPAGETVYVRGDASFVFAWTMSCRNDFWVPVSWTDGLGRVFNGFMHSAQFSAQFGPGPSQLPTAPVRG